MPKRSASEATGIIQATIVKKCDRTFHRPESNKGCTSGSCQHTCDPAQVEQCPHKWTVRYSVNSRQREASFKTQTEAQVFQAELSAKKVTQGALFVDPRAGVMKFSDMRRQYTARLDVSAGSLKGYECNFRGSAEGALRASTQKYGGPRRTRQAAAARVPAVPKTRPPRALRIHRGKRPPPSSRGMTATGQAPRVPAQRRPRRARHCAPRTVPENPV